MKSRLYLIIASFLIVPLITSCVATTESVAVKVTPESLQARAVERSTARWKALTDKRFEDSFAFLSEASRAGITATEYGETMRRMGFLAATVEKATCTETLCTVRAQTTLPVMIRGVGRRLQTIPVEEQWIPLNGELWLIRK